MKMVTVKIARRQSDTTAEGFVVGPFTVHRCTHPIGNMFPKWGVTHSATGYNAAYGPTKAACMHAAMRLRDIGVNWDFDHPNAVKNFPAKKLAAINVIRTSCARGGTA